MQQHPLRGEQLTSFPKLPRSAPMGRTIPELRRVGVIGGGAAGIIATKCLREVGHEVVVFEKAAQVGGVWKYDESPDAQSSVLYESLHTNLPTAIMQVRGVSFPEDIPSFPSHRNVLEYLQKYSSTFGVDPFVRLNSTVTKTEKVDGKWRVSISSADKGDYQEDFDRLLVCNGHFSKPQFADIKGIERFPGRVSHSRSYRTPDQYAGKRVVVIGRGPSGQDISLELTASGAKEVYVATLDYDPNAKQDERDQRILKPAIDHIADDGSVVFTDGSVIPAPDEIMHCTGYLYTVTDFVPSDVLFPNGATDAMEAAELNNVGSDELRELQRLATRQELVAPLYKHFFAIEDPSIGFVGLPFSNLPFWCFELQVRWAARVFSGEVALPSKESMYAEFFELVRELAGAYKYLHKLGAKQQAYFTELASLSETRVNNFVHEIYADAGFLRVNFPYDYRSAEYKRDASTGKWVRRVTPPTEPSELVEGFSSD